MAIHYKCRHCGTEIGILPFESAEGNDSRATKDGRRGRRTFSDIGQDGKLTVQCICEQCEQSLRGFRIIIRLTIGFNRITFWR